MMCGIACGVTTAVLGTVFLLASTIVGYGFMNGIIENLVVNEVALYDDSTQMERFEQVPFPLNFTIRVFNITNGAEVLTGAIPVVNEVGPYIYKLYQSRNIIYADEETLEYEILERFEFDAEASYPYTEDDIITVVNVPYNAVLQVAEVEYPELIGVLSLALNGVFGGLNTPVVATRAGDLFLDGIPICSNPGLVGWAACTQIRAIAATSKNMALQPDGTLLFSVFGYRNGIPSPRYKVQRGINDARDVARIITYDDSYRLRFWPEGDEGSIDEHSPNICNMLNGTDTGTLPPFLQKGQSIYVFKSDICRSVELQYHSESEFRDVPVVRFATAESFLHNTENCFCLNLTRGVTGPDGCLLPGAQELFSCVGAFLVLSTPHFLYADPAYLNGVIGMTPDEDIHRIIMEIEPNTGILLKGSAKAQFNMFLRPISQIRATSSLPNTLTPIFWVEEGIEALPDEYLDQLKEELLGPLRLVDILVPVLVAASCIVLVVGLGLTARGYLKRSAK